MFLLTMILLSIACFILETTPELKGTDQQVWDIFEMVTTSVFSIEYLLRLFVCNIYGANPLHWVLRPMNLCDLLAISPFSIENLIVKQHDTLKDVREFQALR